MITLITGLPGNGKTLYALTWLKELAEGQFITSDGKIVPRSAVVFDAKTGELVSPPDAVPRPVYYSGIKDCMIPGWVEGDPEKWMNLPKGSIILIDEVQRLMRPRQHGSKVPDFVAALETHRHLGVDLVLITQHPMLLDSNVRRLVGQHFHMIRKFGTHMAVAHEWGAVKENCDKNREDSIEHQWRFPKESFALYKSAEVHTHTRRIPLKVKLLLALPFVLAGLVWFTYDRLMNKPKTPVVNAFTGATAAPGGSGTASKLTRLEYIDQFKPRIAGLAYTAPVYDKITEPVIAPYPAACISSASRCSCYTQQGTHLQTTEDLCRSIAAGGFFVAWSQPVAQAVAYKPPEPSKPEPVSQPSAATFLPYTRPVPPPTPHPEPTDNPGRGKALPPPARS